jgi:hypothetical protein
VRLVVAYCGGNGEEELLRDPERLAACGVSEGAMVWLDLEEMGWGCWRWGRALRLRMGQVGV